MSDHEFYSDDDEDENAPGFKIKCHAIMHTYNGLIDPAKEDDKITFDEFRPLYLDLCQDTDHVSMCHELGSRHHAHTFKDRVKQIDCLNSHYAINEITPNVKCNKIKGSGFRNSANRGHFYVSCIYKNTYIDGWTNYPPNVAYSVKTVWIMELWRQSKINCDKVVECLAHYKCLTPASQAEVNLTRAKNREIYKRQKTLERAQRLMAKRLPFKSYPEVDTFLEQYKFEADRYKFLVITGPSRYGKTSFAKSLFKNPFIHPCAIDWYSYDDEEHDAIIFDDVFKIEDYIAKNMLMYQASGPVAVNTSQTNCHSFHVDVTQKPIVICALHFVHTDWTDSNTFNLEVEAPTFSPP